MRPLAACIALCGLACAASAQGAIHVQRDATSGALVYSNVPQPGRAGMPPATGPAPARARAALPAPAPQLAGFPVVAQAEQRQRDRERNAILHEELDQERLRLTLARGTGAAPDVQHRHRSNIDALLREIAATGLP